MPRALDEAHRRHSVNRHPIGRTIQRLLPPLGHDLAHGFSHFIDLLVGVRPFGPKHRDNPVKVGMAQVGDEPTATAASAGYRRVCPIRRLTEHQLREPPPDSLPSYSLGPLQQERLREAPASPGQSELACGGCVPNERDRRHSTNMACGGPKWKARATVNAL